MVSPITVDHAKHTDIEESVSKITCDFNVSGAGQLTIVVADPKLRMFKANYFQVRQELTYAGVVYEMAAIEIGKGDANEQVTIEARSRNVQRMKRDKGQMSWGSMSPSSFAKMMASQFGMTFLIEPTATIAPPTPGSTSPAASNAIIRVRNATTDESTWDVLNRLAGSWHYWFFESDGRLFFASQEYLLGKVGAGIQLIYPYPENRPVLQLLTIPQVRTSDDDPNGATYNADVHHTVGRKLRPGMTFTSSGLGRFDMRYLINHVSYDEIINAPVHIDANTPENPKLRVGGLNDFVGHPAPSEVTGPSGP